MAWREVCAVEVSALVAALPAIDWPRASIKRLEYAMVERWPATFDPRPIFAAVQTHFPDRRRGKTMISRLVPGQTIPPHRDRHDNDCRCRIHVPLITNPLAMFTLEGDTFHMEQGRAYQIDPTGIHSVTNGGATDRVHLIFNLIG